MVRPQAALELEIREFRFRGELHKAGHLAELGRRIRQQELPQQVLRLIPADAQYEGFEGGVVRREDRRDIGKLILWLAVACAEVCII